MRLLVSVLEANEVPSAVLGGADILDVKNPAEGALGAPRPSVLGAIRRATPKNLPLSVALGDMPHLPGTAALAAVGAASCGADFVKVGLWGSRSEAQATELVAAICDALAGTPAIQVIAAGYADWQRAGTLDARLLPRVARAAGAAGCLIDTAIKDGRTLFDFMTPDALAALAAEAHAAGLLLALAGSLRAADLPLVKRLGADVAGVRSAACRGGRRAGPLDLECVKQLRLAMLQASAP